jgi:hypothetical protein
MSGISNYGESALLDVFFNGTNNAKTARYAKLHTGDPGEAGTANPATEATRKAITSAAASGGVFTSVNALTWTSVAATETYSHLSIWDDLTAGNCLWKGPLTASKAVTAGDNFEIAAGSLTVSLD